MLRSEANNADPDQKPLSAISEPVLHLVYLHLGNIIFSFIQTMKYLNIRRILGHDFRIYINCKAWASVLGASYEGCSE